jgi:hypothetical protein
MFGAMTARTTKGNHMKNGTESKKESDPQGPEGEGEAPKANGSEASEGGEASEGTRRPAPLDR